MKLALFYTCGLLLAPMPVLFESASYGRIVLPSAGTSLCFLILIATGVYTAKRLLGMQSRSLPNSKLLAAALITTSTALLFLAVSIYKAFRLLGMSI